MSKFEKIIVPFIDDTIQQKDLTASAGFIDSYTYDIDHPDDKYQFFLVYDADLRNSDTIDRAIRFDKCKCIKNVYVKFVDGKALLVYQFWVKPELKKLYEGVLHLNTDEKIKIYNFWGPVYSIVDEVMSNNTVLADSYHGMPAEDYRKIPNESWLLL